MIDGQVADDHTTGAGGRAVSDPERKARAAARRRRAVLHKTDLQAIEDDLSPCRGSEGVSLVHRLTLESWSLAGQTSPQYTRDQLPWRFVPGRRT